MMQIQTTGRLITLNNGRFSKLHRTGMEDRDFQNGWVLSRLVARMPRFDDYQTVNRHYSSIATYAHWTVPGVQLVENFPKYG